MLTKCWMKRLGEKSIPVVLEGHSLVGTVEEAMKGHSVSKGKRGSQDDLQGKDVGETVTRSSPGKEDRCTTPV